MILCFLYIYLLAVKIRTALTFHLCLFLTVSAYWEDFFYHLGIVRHVKTKDMQQFLTLKKKEITVKNFFLYGWSSEIKPAICVHRFSLVDPGNIVRLLAPDLGIFFSSLFVLRLCNKLTRPAPQVNLHENGILPIEAEVKARLPLLLHITVRMGSRIDPVVLLACQEGETSETESEEESDTEGSSFDSSEETTGPVQSGPPQFVQKLIMFAAGLKLLLSAIMNTAGKVVVTFLLGLAGTISAGHSW